MFREISADPECSSFRIPRNFLVYGKGDGGSMAGAGQFECGALGELEITPLFRSTTGSSGLCCFCRIAQASSGRDEP